MEQDPIKAERQRGWTSLGSEAEVEEEQWQPSAPSLTFEYAKTTRSKPVLSDSNPNIVNYLATAGPDFISSTTRMEQNIGVQAVQLTREISVQTVRKQLVASETQYEAITIPDSRIAELLTNVDFIDFLSVTEKLVESALVENTLFDLNHDIYAALAVESGDIDFVVERESKLELMEVQSFSDLQYTKQKSVSFMEWHPEIPGVFAMSTCSRATMNERIEQSFKIKTRQSTISFWCTTRPHKALLFLDAPDDIMVFGFHPQDNSVIIAGCVNGQVVLWDISQHRQSLDPAEENPSPHGPLNKKLSFRGAFDEGNSNEAIFVKHSLICAMDGGHRLSIIDLTFIPHEYCVNKLGKTRENIDGPSQFLTSSLDGQISVWEVPATGRYVEIAQSWRPIFKFTAASPDGSVEYGCTKLGIFHRTAGDLQRSTNDQYHSCSHMLETTTSNPVLMVGTEEGDLISCNWNIDYLHDKSSHVDSIIPCHLSCVSSIRLSPQMPSVFASVGGRTLQLWDIDHMVRS